MKKNRKQRQQRPEPVADDPRSSGDRRLRYRLLGYRLLGYRQLRYWLLVIVVLLFAGAVALNGLPDPQVAQNSSEQQDASAGNHGSLTSKDINAPDQAVKNYSEMLQSRPDSFLAHNELGVVLHTQGKFDKAMDHYRQALRINPDYAEAHNNLGSIQLTHQKIDEAIKHFRQALRINPDYMMAHNNLGAALLENKKIDEAIEHFQEALRIDPDFPKARENLNIALQRQAVALFQQGDDLQKQGKAAEAIDHFQRVLQINPDHLEALNNLAWIRATHANSALRDGSKAVELAEWCCRLTGYRAPAAFDTLAAAYAESGRFDDAIKTVSKAIDLATAEGNKELTWEMRKRLIMYQRRAAYRDPSQGTIEE